MDFSKAAVAVLIVLGGLIFYRMQHPLASMAKDITSSDWDQVVQDNHVAGRPSLVFFSTSSCGYCRAMEDKVFSRDDVKAELKQHYAFYTVDLSSETEEIHDRAVRHGINYVPILIRYDAFGRENGRASYMGPSEMMDFLVGGE
jgi:thioredoxin-related protein